MLSSARRMFWRSTERVPLSSATTGLFSELSSARRSRWSFMELYWLIWESMEVSLMPRLEGMRSLALEGSTRYSLMNIAMRNWVSYWRASA